MKKGNTYAIILTVLFMVTAGCGCRRHKSPGNLAKEFYSGIFVIDEAGKPQFTDCATSITMDIEVNSRYENIRKKYGYIGLQRGEEILVEFTGKLNWAYNDAFPEYNGKRPAISIDSVINVYRDRKCVSDFTIPGIYQTDSHEEGDKQVLRLKPDYTYTYTSFGDYGTETSKKGRWHRNALLILVLTEDSQEGSVETFQIIPAKESISRNSGGKPSTFKKVYL